ncbi:hypothetical protein [Bacteroides fragilis]|uniref:hypothetical protein n=1 Tax=Bacteroides fragilis TaxID=817 RepID=UPI000B28DA80|nr:hypothetical protein [Bacteroides fragilis]
MKTLYRYLALALLIVLNTSCLKSGLDELETYDQNDICNKQTGILKMKIKSK